MSTIHCNQDEITLIQDEITQVDNAISQLQDKRSALIQRLNYAQSATRNLPTETLSLIFKHYIASDSPLQSFPSPVPSGAGGYLGPLTLGHVSSYWRQIIWSTPHFWATLRIGLREKKPYRIPGILELHLQNVGNLPFNLDLECAVVLVDFEKPIRDILIRYSRKVHRLILSNPPTGWFNSLREFSSLEWISVLDVTREGQLLLSELPQLRHIALRSLHRQGIQLPLKTTTLELSHFTTYKSAALLAQCPNLVKFSLEYPFPSDPDTPPESIFPTPITFCQLQDFSWSYCSSPWDRAVFQNVRLPALSKLKLNFNQEGDEADILTLFNNLQDTLQDLIINGLERWTIPLARKIFSRSLSLRKMTLFITNAASLYSLVRALCPGWDGDNTTFLPLLTDFTIKCYGFQQEVRTLQPEFSSQILDFCRARSAIPNFEVFFDLGPIELPWAPGVLEELSAMVRDGFNLYIRHSNEIVRWLS